MVFRVHFSAPVDYWVENIAGAVREPGVRPLRTSDVPRSLAARPAGPRPGRRPALAGVATGASSTCRRAPPSARLVVPTRAHPLHPGAKVLTVRFTARSLDRPLVASVRVS